MGPVPAPLLDGLVRRTVHPEVPVRVEHALTDAGRTAAGAAPALQEWSVRHLRAVSASQAAYDQVDQAPSGVPAAGA